ncbi:MAG: MBL fold metallo-hydrolase [Ghiorsea sp.]
MQITFWGVRGSIASPGPKTVRYGGNTTCIEIRAGDELIILDGGTGIFPLSQTLFPELPRKSHIFVTHTHWDHIQGLPFFIPIFIPDNHIHLYGAFDPVNNKGIEQAYDVQLQYSFFPIREVELNAEIHYQSLFPGEVVQIGDVTIRTVLMNHPVVNLGYRVEYKGKSVFFTGDHEPPYNLYAEDDEDFQDCELMIAQKTQDIDDAMRDVDVLIADSSYTPEEYVQKKGWGHGTYDSCMAMAERVGAKQLFCTHHEPTRSDDALEKAFAEALERCQPSSAVDVQLAKEGLTIKL